MKKVILTSAIFLFCIYSVSAGGPWPQRKGFGYFKLSEWWIVFDRHYTDSGLTDPNVTTGIFNTSFYGEYGVTDRFTVGINAPLLSRTYMNNLRSTATDEIIVPGEAINTIGDIDLAFKYGLTKPGAKIPISATLTLGLPTGKTSGGSQGNLQTGDGEFNQLFQIDAGTGFKLNNVSAYASTYVGINHRTKEFSEEFRFGLEFGVGLFKEKLWVNSKFNLLESFQNGATAETTTSTSLFANNAEYAAISFEAAYYIKKGWGISAGYGTAFRGQIIAAAPSYNVGVFFDMGRR